MALKTIDDIKNLYNRLKSERRILNWGEFSAAIGYDRAYISRVVNGREPLTEDVIKAVTIYETQNVPHETYQQERFKKKNGHSDDGIIYVPVSAQAGYSKRVKEQHFENEFEKVYIPGLQYKGAKYRMFEVDGDSMAPGLKEGVQVIAELVEPDDWKNIANYYIYVLVSDDMITIKRVFRKSPERWVLISDNEEFYDQISFDVKNLKELWKVKRKLDWDLAPPKKFEIKIK